MPDKESRNEDVSGPDGPTWFFAPGGYVYMSEPGMGPVTPIVLQECEVCDPRHWLGLSEVQSEGRPVGIYLRGAI